jgi:small-conductance mechanosensitive channel
VVTVVIARLARAISRSASRNALWDVQLVLLVGRAVYIAVLVLGFLAFVKVVAPQWLAPVLGFFGLLGLAFGLAFQDVLKNWISGVFLLMERPFRIGDDVSIGDFSGTVETIRLRVTVLRTLDGRRVLVPNQVVYTSTIVDSSSYPVRQFTVVAALAPDRPLGEVLRQAAVAVRGIEGVSEEPASEVSLVPSIEHGPTIEARFWVEVQKFKVRTVQRQVSAALTALAAGQEVSADDLGLAAAMGGARKPPPPEPKPRAPRRARIADLTATLKKGKDS